MSSFSTTDAEPDFYVEGCESVERWENDSESKDRFAAFRDELAAHIRDSSDRPLGRRESQWRNDEWLRNLWYDLFGPEPAPGDPYPVPPDDWGRRRYTPYMEYGVSDRAEDGTEPERAWLAARGLTHGDLRPGASTRPQPEDYQERLERLTREGARQAVPSERWSEPS
ncbi:hypothetical protein [Jiangella asiatica]|uniref:Uncharacterized protein n=1 Tax=Jiangella asiatica TaxID=2530372 RepID=A0A4V2Z2J1_9ACTN|nr:hypothetical protein [Jiangella asiatica]TDE09078.1 hypothetical protein E1269_15285 [Jiangella asiatica]